MSEQSRKSCSSFVAPASILPEAVRDIAGAQGICHVQVVRSLGEAEYIVRVSALHLLLSPQSYVIVLKGAELDQCLPCQNWQVGREDKGKHV